jgi:hypothetical protein
MVRRHANSRDFVDAERTAMICLLRDVMRGEAKSLAESLGRRLDAGGLSAPLVRRGFALRSLAALRNERAADALRWTGRADGTYAGIVRAMAEHELGRDEAARDALERARQALGGDVEALLARAARDPYGDETRNINQARLLFRALLFREAEAAIRLDPTFPADPFARER